MILSLRAKLLLPNNCPIPDLPVRMFLITVPLSINYMHPHTWEGTGTNLPILHEPQNPPRNLTLDTPLPMTIPSILLSVHVLSSSYSLPSHPVSVILFGTRFSCDENIPELQTEDLKRAFKKNE